MLEQKDVVAWANKSVLKTVFESTGIFTLLPVVVIMRVTRRK